MHFLIISSNSFEIDIAGNNASSGMNEWSGGGEGEGIEDEGVVVPAVTAPKEPHNSLSGKKRKAATQVEEQPQNVKKVKTALPTVKHGGRGHPAWTAEEEAALVEGVDEYRLDFDRIKAEVGARPGDRKAKALHAHFRERHPDEFRKLRAANPVKWTGKDFAWTKEEDEALRRGVLKHGADYNKILETVNEVLGRRTVKAIQSRYTRIKNN
ncbi:hypothetical protein TL16_g12706 [Triparma laevis f. inornata]|uniref:Myb-like domain-containing protein n=1 Tax=Triparma laevis f. inornata TaxID=1714386 RepID=A0A9W7BTB7_9STRA|nr:hypothetical protein TL16_g12706 [Triparma laevis f. inornata]